MFWADSIAAEILERYREALKGKMPLIVRDEKTASGRVHIGSMRGVAVHGIVADILKSHGVDLKFLYEINDFDPMDGIPANLPESEWKQYLGLPLNKVPSPAPGAKNFAEYYAAEFMRIITESGFTPEFYRASELYESGNMNEVIRLALDRADAIRRIYLEVSGSQKPEVWLPISIICSDCGKIGTTQAFRWNGEQVEYRCTKGPGGAEGCGHEGKRSPFDGNAKLPWKVEWPAKWKVVGVQVEGAGKDHSTKGGARDVANHIAREVFSVDTPHDIPYEFFLVGGEKMSSSKGKGSSAAEVAALVPPSIIRLALLGTLPHRAINFDPAGETVPTWFDWHDKIAEKYWDTVGDDDARLFELIYHHQPPLKQFLPRFSSVAFVVQMQHLNIHMEFEKMKGGPLTAEESATLSERAKYAVQWLKEHAPERYRFTLHLDTIPESARTLSHDQKTALKQLLAFVDMHKDLEGQVLHTAIHEIRKTTGIDPKLFFSAIYLIFLGRDSGPQAGWFLSTLDRSFLIKRLQEAIV
ncbi:MAG: lysine--tRNA ligase [Patescibacteria group bacterium]